MEKIIELKDRIDTSNIQSVEENINKEIGDFDGDIVLDVQNLEYISSVGLRIILKLKKTHQNLKIINCNEDVYEIFDVTGFTKIIDVSRQYKSISVDNCKVIGEGANGLVYRLDSDTIVKVYKNKDSLDIIKKERNGARNAFILGIPTAISYDIVRVGDLYGSVFEMINAKSFSELINDGEDVDKIVKESVDLLKIIHSCESNEDIFPNKKDEALNWAMDIKDYLPSEIGNKLINMFRGIKEVNTVIHGDFHVKNIMKMNNENILIDMETVAIGHPIFDLACSYTIYEGFECVDEFNPQNFLNIPRKTCRKFIDSTFKYYFNDKTEEEIDEIKTMVRIICYTRLFRRQIKHFGINDDIKYTIDFCKNYLIENVPKVDKLYF